MADTRIIAMAAYIAMHKLYIAGARALLDRHRTEGLLSHKPTFSWQRDTSAGDASDGYLGRWLSFGPELLVHRCWNAFPRVQSIGTGDS